MTTAKLIAELDRDQTDIAMGQTRITYDGKFYALPTVLVEQLRAALAAREGFVLVPREPTMGQWDDFCSVYPIRFDQFMAAYKAMITAPSENEHG